MSPQRSNRSSLVEGALRCLERLPPERITARAIAEESGANLASITYHFGSKDNLVTEAAITGLDRWLADIAVGLHDLPSQSPASRFRRAGEVIESSRQRHAGLARNFVGALAKAQHDPRVRDLLADGFRRSRPAVATLLGWATTRQARMPPASSWPCSTAYSYRSSSILPSPSTATAWNTPRPASPGSSPTTAIRPPDASPGQSWTTTPDLARSSLTRVSGPRVLAMQQLHGPRNGVRPAGVSWPDTAQRRVWRGSASMESGRFGRSQPGHRRDVGQAPEVASMESGRFGRSQTTMAASCHLSRSAWASTPQWSPAGSAGVS